MNEIIEVLKEELGLTKKQIKEILENEDKLGNPDIIPIIEKTIELTRQKTIEMIDTTSKIVNKRLKQHQEDWANVARGSNNVQKRVINARIGETDFFIQELQDLKRKVR